ncbi:hypothetical protein AX14_006336 [Amanita brunnescens Koide BX004]|nr:hypothetical protein AX14_006336 [Amanita brunnescens Koide BX004]
MFTPKFVHTATFCPIWTFIGVTRPEHEVIAKVNTCRCPEIDVTVAPGLGDIALWEVLIQFVLHLKSLPTCKCLSPHPLPMSITKDASFPEIQDVTAEPEVPGPLHRTWTLVAMIFTLGIPGFHASLATIASDTNLAAIMRDTTLDLKAAVPVWEAVRHFDTVLLAAIVTTSFKESVQADPVCWFFIASSLLQAFMALIYSTFLIIMFLGGHKEYTYSAVNEDQLRFLRWSVWDHFSLPAILTVWSILTFMVALIVDAVWPGAAKHHLEAYFTVAKAMSFLALCFAAARFVIFLFQLRRISQALYQAARAESA